MRYVSQTYCFVFKTVWTQWQTSPLIWLNETHKHTTKREACHRDICFKRTTLPFPLWKPLWHAPQPRTTALVEQSVVFTILPAKRVLVHVHPDFPPSNCHFLCTKHCFCSIKQLATQLIQLKLINYLLNIRCTVK